MVSNFDLKAMLRDEICLANCNANLELTHVKHQSKSVLAGTLRANSIEI